MLTFSIWKPTQISYVASILLMAGSKTNHLLRLNMRSQFGSNQGMTQRHGGDYSRFDPNPEGKFVTSRLVTGIASRPRVSEPMQITTSLGSTIHTSPPGRTEARSRKCARP